MPVGIYFLDVLIAEVGADDHKCLDRIPITFDAGLKIEVEPGSPLISLCLEVESLGSLNSVVGIEKGYLSILTFVQIEFLFGKVFDLIGGGIQLFLESRVGGNGESKRPAHTLTQRVRDQIDSIGWIYRLSIRKGGHSPFGDDTTLVRYRGHPMIGLDLDTAGFSDCSRSGRYSGFNFLLNRWRGCLVRRRGSRIDGRPILLNQVRRFGIDLVMNV